MANRRPRSVPIGSLFLASLFISLVFLLALLALAGLVDDRFERVWSVRLWLRSPFLEIRFRSDKPVAETFEK